MKSRHLVTAGLGLVTFISLGVLPAQKALSQEGIVYSDQGEPFFVSRGKDIGTRVRCTRDAAECFSLTFVGCNQQNYCFFKLQRIPPNSSFHNPLVAQACWSGNWTFLLGFGSPDCRVYGVSAEVSADRLEQGRQEREELERAVREPYR